jgi:hypothetical protein
MSFPLSDLYDFILPFVPVVDTPLVDNALIRAVRVVACQTGIHRGVVTDNTVIGQNDYTLTPPTGYEIDSILQVRLYPASDSSGKGVKLYPISDSVLNDMLTFDAALPTSWRYIAGGAFSLYPTPDSVEEFKVTAILRPELDTALELDQVYYQYRELIADGAMAFLFAMPAKPWTNEKQSAQSYARFGQGVLALRARIRAGGQVNNGTLKSVRFGA